MLVVLVLFYLFELRDMTLYDNSRPHVARVVIDFLAQLHVNVLSWRAVLHRFHTN